MQDTPYIRLLIVVITVCLCAVSTPAQDINTPISIEAQSATTTDLLEIVSKQCQCYFAYPSDLTDETRIHKVSPYEGDAETFIRTLFQDSIVFENFKNQVILRPAGAKIIAAAPKNEEIITLSGIIEDSETKQPIPYASISIHGSMLGTISNAEGYFKFKLPTQLQDSTLQVSCMGYFTHSLQPSEIKENGIIYLNVANISLQEVVVRSVGTHYIIEQAKQTLDRNYRKTPYGYQAFYRELGLKRDEHVNYNEALFEGYSPKGSISRDNLVLKKGRKFTQNSYRDTLQLKLKGGTEAALQLDIANFRPDFLQTESEKHYHYRINDLTMWHDELVYIITFKPKAYSSNAKFSGELYISFSDFSLLGAHFSYVRQHLQIMKDALVIKKARGTKVKPTKYTYHVEYQKLNDKYHINYVKGHVTIEAKKKHQLRYVPFSTIFEMTLTAIDTTTIHRPKYLKPYRTSSIFSEQIEFSTEEFWHYNNRIIPEGKIMKTFYESGFTLEEQESLLREE